MKNLLIISALALTGCASTYTSPAQMTRTASGDNVTITGTMDSKQTSPITVLNILTVSINGEKAFSGEVDANFTGDVAGNWHGKPVSASCSSVRHDSSIDVRCMVFFGNERTVTLTF